MIRTAPPVNTAGAVPPPLSPASAPRITSGRAHRSVAWTRVTVPNRGGLTPDSRAASRDPHASQAQDDRVDTSAGPRARQTAGEHDGRGTRSHAGTHPWPPRPHRGATTRTHRRAAALCWWPAVSPPAHDHAAPQPHGEQPPEHHLVTVEGNPVALIPRTQVTTRHPLRDGLPVHSEDLRRLRLDHPHEQNTKARTQEIVQVAVPHIQAVCGIGSAFHAPRSDRSR